VLWGWVGCWERFEKKLKKLVFFFFFLHLEDEFGEKWR